MLLVVDKIPMILLLLAVEPAILQDDSAIRSPEAAMNIHVINSAIVDGKNPGCAVTDGSAKIPAPIVVPLIRETADASESGFSLVKWSI